MISDKQIDRFFEGHSTAEEIKELKAWFATKEGVLFLSQSMDHDFSLIEEGSEQSYVDHPIPSEEMLRYILKKLLKRQRVKRFLRVAAILLPILFILGQFWYFNRHVDLFTPTTYQTIYVPKGERLQLVFQDGSKVFLNSDSRLIYPNKFSLSERKMILEGEGFFEVVTSKHRPFIVDLNGVAAKVTGTRFNVKAYPSDDYVLLSLEKGKVALESKKQTLFALNPGEQSHYNRSSGEYAISTPEKVENVFAYKKNIVVFDNTPLSEVLTILSRGHNIIFYIEDSLSLNYNITLTSSQRDLSFILRELEKIIPVRFTEISGGYDVKMKKQ